MINYNLKINFQDEKVLSSDIVFVSSDIGAYKLVFDFYDNGKKVDISNYALTVKAKRADGVKIASTGEIEDGQAVFIPENNIYSIPGDLYLEIALCDASGKYLTAKVIIASVIEGLGEADVEGTDVPSVYVTLLSAVQEKIDQVNHLVQHSIPKKGVDYYTEEERQEFVSQILKTSGDYLIPQKFGAMADGVTDDTAAIQQAVAMLTDNSRLVFPTGHYLVSATKAWDSIIKLDGLKNVTIDFQGSVIEVIPNGFIGYNVIGVKDCTDFKIKNGIIVGDRKNHDYTTTSSTHEWCYGIDVQGASSESSVKGEVSGIISGMEISEFPGDAMNLQNRFSGGVITIDNCNLHHSRRQGISMHDGDIYVVKNTEIHHIGTFDNIEGTSPLSGIDIEPASGTTWVNDVILENVSIHDTTGFSILSGICRATGADHAHCVRNKVIMDRVKTDSSINFYPGNIVECRYCDFKVAKDSSSGKQSVFYSTVDMYYCKGELSGVNMSMNLSHCDITFVDLPGKEGQGIMYYGIADNSILRNARLSGNSGGKPSATTTNTVFYGAVLSGWTPFTLINCKFHGTKTYNLTAAFTFINCLFDAKVTGAGSGKCSYVNCYDVTGAAL